MGTAVRTSLSEVVAANIRAEGARRGWTQSDVATRLGQSRMWVSDRYRGRTPWTIDELDRVAELLGLDTVDLLARPKGFEPLTF